VLLRFARNDISEAEVGVKRKPSYNRVALCAMKS